MGAKNSSIKSEDIRMNNKLETNIHLQQHEKRTEETIGQDRPIPMTIKTQSINITRKTNSPKYEHVESNKNAKERTHDNDPEILSEQTIKHVKLHVVNTRKHLDVKERLCPICFERAFKNPKLLPCSHTFCYPCLQDHLKSNVQRETLVCPLCRANVYVPENGINGFIENYFVLQAKITLCDSCRDNDSNTVCKICDKMLCNGCFINKRHRCKRADDNRISGVGGSSSESDDSDTASSVAVVDTSIPGSFKRPNMPWTKILLSTRADFRIPEGHKCCFIVPVSQTSAWIILSYSENVSLNLIDTNGTITKTIPIPSIAVSLAVEHSESILVPFPEEAVVCRFQGDEFTTIVRPSIFHPTAVACYPNGEFIVAGANKTNVEENCHGHVKLFSDKGTELTDFSIGTNVVPFCICILDNDLICLSYPENHFIDIRFKNGQIVGHYGGNDAGIDDEYFNPTSICVGFYGNNPCIFISDDYCDVIHVISQTGKFIGLALKFQNNRSADMGEPGFLGFHNSGKLWVSQANDETVSIYNTCICDYLNVMDDD